MLAHVHIQSKREAAWQAGNLRDEALPAHTVGPDDLRVVGVASQGGGKVAGAVRLQDVQQALWQQGSQVAAHRQLSQTRRAGAAGMLDCM